MKKYLLAIILTIAVSTGFSQVYPLAKGGFVNNITAGFGNGQLARSFGYAVGISSERCFFDELFNGDFSLGIGAYLGYSSTYENTYRRTSVNRVEEIRVDYTTKVVAFRSTLHYTGLRQLDFYYGFHMGVAWYTTSLDGSDPLTDLWPIKIGDMQSLLLSPCLGARYYFTDSFGAVCELMGGLGYVNLGLTVKI